jgi:glycyl-tRNA synthetase beta chain
MHNLLLEIGTEEIPAGYIGPALADLSSRLSQRLDQARIDHGEVHTFGTPRRLAVAVDKVAERQHTITQQITGPPQKIAFDEVGKPTTATIRFAAKVGVAVSRLKTVETERGRYMSATKTIRGLAATTLLRTILPEVVLAIPFPKTMRWSDLSIAFARPIQSILALWGERVISFTIGGKIRSGRFSMGHTFMHPGKIKINHTGEYRKALRNAGVIIEIGERKKEVLAQIEAAADSVGGKVLPDEALVDIVTNLVEAPFAIAGNFDADFIGLPRPVLITAMREHQKYFAMVDLDGRLMPNFIAVNNTRTRDMDLVRLGHERVLRARLADAKFFYASDRQMAMETWVDKLEGVLFQAELGSMYAKTKRVGRLAAFLSDRAAPTLKASVCRAAYLAKADLVSQVVVEFPKLQGIMGRVYAAKAGEPDDVAKAIEEHYRPLHSGGVLPESDAGALLAMADKFDSICGCFAVGLNPTGASDPYALRRQGIGIIRIMLARKIDIPLNRIIATSLQLFKQVNHAKQQSIAGAVADFFKRRMASLLTEQGYPKDIIAAVLDLSADSVPDTWARIRALMEFRRGTDYGPFILLCKRIGNILKKAQTDTSLAGIDKVDPKYFQESPEKELYSVHVQVADRVGGYLIHKQFSKALTAAASMRSRVDTFFEDVRIMDRDPRIRRNRLALLGAIASMFGELADFSKINM